MRKKNKYYRRKKNKRKKKVFIKTFKINNLYISIISILIILLLISIVSNENISIFNFLMHNIVPSYTNISQKENIEETIVGNPTTVIGVNDVIFENEDDKQIPETESNNHQPIQAYDIDKLNDPEYLRNNFYIVDQRTQFVPSQFSASEFISKDLTIDTSGSDPKVLIFHTHSHEDFVGSEPNNPNDTIYGIGEMLAHTLTNKYGIITMHDEGKYDYVNGKTQILGAYERMEPAIQKVLNDNPSIEVAIDLHRDGVGDNVRLVKNVDGKPTAQVMFFNGLCKYLDNGKLVSGAQNPYLSDNLAFSFQMQLKAKELYPEFTRKIYLHAYRFSLHMKPRSLLIELGAQTNTIEEARNAVEPLAKILAEVLTK